MSQAKKRNYRDILARNLAKFRQKNGLKREELSLALSFDNSYISKIEKGKINITLDRLEAIANYLNINIIELFK